MPMHTCMTTIQTKAALVTEFLAVSTPFASACLREPGLVSFALLQQVNAQNIFSLFEVYHDELAWKTHLDSQHYLAWQAGITRLLEQPLTTRRYSPIFPPPEDWEQHLDT
ncbi:MAG: putative quinol monooxygenase [Chloroflexota bacterium]